MASKWMTLEKEFHQEKSLTLSHETQLKEQLEHLKKVRFQENCSIEQRQPEPRNAIPSRHACTEEISATFISFFLFRLRFTSSRLLETSSLDRSSFSFFFQSSLSQSSLLHDCHCNLSNLLPVKESLFQQRKEMAIGQQRIPSHISFP